MNHRTPRKAVNGRTWDRRAACELDPAATSGQSELELASAGASADPDQSEVADARRTWLRVPFKLYHRMSAFDCLKCDCGANDTAADDDNAFQGQGSVNNFVVVIPRMASMTPSLTPSPESLMPPNGVSSVR